MTSLPLSQAFAFRISHAAPIPIPQQSRLMMALEIRMAEAMAAEKPKIISECAPCPETLAKSIDTRRLNAAKRHKARYAKILAFIAKNGPQPSKRVAQLINISQGHTSVVLQKMVEAKMLRCDVIARLPMFSVSE